jgi:histidine phosphotransferase ChpT
MQIDTGVVDLLLSRLLHDLIGPTSATANGAELLQEFGAKNSDPIAAEALELVSNSARQSADRLSYFRLAFGGAGNGEEHTVATIRRLVETYLASRKISCEFSSTAKDGAVPRAGIAKSVLAVTFLMADALPRQGKLSVAIDPADNWSASIAVSGPGAQIDGDTAIGLQCGEPEAALTTRTVIGIVVGLTARRFGLKVEIHSEADLARVTLLSTPAS